MQTMPGLIYIVSAPSGAGKTSLVKAVLQQDSSLEVSISHTTRMRRSDEQHGRDYFFVDEAYFHEMITKGEFVEHAKVFDHHYGTSVTSIEAIIGRGHHIVLDIDWQGAQQVRKQFPDNTISIFLLPPSINTLRQRLEKRGQDDEVVIALRMAQAKSEMQHYQEADYVIVNDDFDQALADLLAIIQVGRLRTACQAYQHARLIKQLFEGL